MNGYEFVNRLADLTEKEKSDGKALIKAAEKVFHENYSNSEGDTVIGELLDNYFVYDYKDYSHYVPDGVDIKNCDKAILIKLADDYLFWAKEIENILY